MSVTFSFNLPDGVRFPVGCPGEHVCPDPSGDACRDDLAVYGLCDHIVEGREACCCERFDVNVSNANAALICERLEIDVDPECVAGRINAQDLIARAMLANIGRDDSGVAHAESIGGRGAHMIDCGVRPGYFDDVMGRLADLGKAAHDRGYSVSFA